MISLITDKNDQQIAGTYPAYVGKNYGAVSTLQWNDNSCENKIDKFRCVITLQSNARISKTAKMAGIIFQIQALIDLFIYRNNQLINLGIKRTSNFQKNLMEAMKQSVLPSSNNWVVKLLLMAGSQFLLQIYDAW